jgi:hypothetical protein
MLHQKALGLELAGWSGFSLQRQDAGKLYEAAISFTDT